MRSRISVKEGYRLDYIFPKECQPPTLKEGEKAKCKAIKGFKAASCTVIKDGDEYKM